MKVHCQFCGKQLSSQRGLNTHLQSCNPIMNTHVSGQYNSIVGRTALDFVSNDDRIPSNMYENHNVDFHFNNPNIQFFNFDRESMTSSNSQITELSYDDMAVSDDDEDSDTVYKYRIENDVYIETSTQTSGHQTELRLLQFCERINAPLYAYDELMKCLSTCHIDDKTFVPDFTRRNVLVHNLKERYRMKESEPRAKDVVLDDGTLIRVMVCPFLPTLHSLLNDPRCMRDDCFTFHNDNPYSVPVETGVRNELHSASWYRNTWKEKCKNKGDFILAFYLFIDKTFTDVYGKLNFEPVQFTLSLFNRKTRNSYHAWRTLGYVNDLKTINHCTQMDHKKRANDIVPHYKDSEINMRDYHKILSVILQEFGEIQSGGNIRYDLKYKNSTYKLNFIPVLGPIIGDTVGHDVLVGRYCGRTNVTRICRYCDCHYDNSDNADYKFQYTKQNDIQKLYVESCKDSKEKLNNISYHHVRNSLHTIYNGSDERGIHGLCPVELLHCMRLGILKIAVECFSDLFTQSYIDKFDKLLSIISRQLRHQSYRGLPKISFSGSIMNLKRKTADEWTGTIFLISASLQTKYAKYICRKAGIQDNIKNSYIKIFEKCLIIEKWLQKEDGYNMHQLEKGREIMIQFMKEYKRTCSRKVGNHMKLVKFHMLLHIIDDIERLGSPQNTNGGPCESNFKPQKKESSRTQRRAHLFHEQMATRIHEQMVIARANVNITEEDTCQQKDRLISGSKFGITYDDIEMMYSLQWKRPIEKKQLYDESIIEFVHRIFFCSDEYSGIECFTEHRINDEIFHGDCSYRGEQEWCDWAQILWDNPEDHCTSRAVIGKIHMFVDCSRYTFQTPQYVNGLDVTGGEIYAIISSLSWREPMKMGVSDIFLKGFLEKNNDEITYYVIPITAINGTAVAMHDIDSDKISIIEDEIIIVTPCEEWNENFYSMYRETT